MMKHTVKLYEQFFTTFNYLLIYITIYTQLTIVVSSIRGLFEVFKELQSKIYLEEN